MKGVVGARKVRVKRSRYRRAGLGVILSAFAQCEAGRNGSEVEVPSQAGPCGGFGRAHSREPLSSKAPGGSLRLHRPPKQA